MVMRMMETTPTIRPALFGPDVLGNTGCTGVTIGLVMGMSHMSPASECPFHII